MSQLYKEAVIHNLNTIEGFKPEKFMRIIQREDGKITVYLDVVIRKLWFRLKYPTGKITKKIIQLTENVAVVEARVYLDHLDQEENYISNDYVQKFRTDDPQFGDKFLELAETAATGRALSDAGFGIQFANLEEEFDPSIVDAGVEIAISDIAASSEVADSSYLSMQEGAVLSEEGMTQTSNLASSQPPVFASSIGQASPVNPLTQNGLQPVKENAVNSTPTITSNMPVEQIYSLLTKEEACKVVVGMGFNKGKTLGQIALEQPQNLNWYMNEYKGPNNLLRAAAKFLVDMGSN